MIDRIGQHFGHYQLIQVLGQGRWASVYLGEHRHLHAQAAIKVLHDPLAAGEVEGFLTEARTLARLRHPHIVRLLDFGLEDDTPFLVIDYAPGGTLRKLHPKGAQLPLETVIPYVKQVAEGLQYAHAQRLIHRDLKPENLLLGPDQEIWLSDFGLAIIAHSAHSQPLQQTAGTLAYMAPEQLQGHPTPASDQYALGVLVYEWLCGECPFAGSFAEVAHKQLSLPPPSLREQVPTLPVAVEYVVLKALAKDPSQRFAGVHDFALALEASSKAESSSRETQLIQSSPYLAASGQSARHNLPTPLTSLIGREQEVTTACLLLRHLEVRLLTITGTGGVGKTRLALQVASELLDDFPEGISFVPLAPISDPNLVLPALAQTLGVKEIAGQSFLDLLKASLREKHLLLFLDNFEQILGAASHLTALLTSCPSLKILVTSRATLHVQGEHEFPVPFLALPDLKELPAPDVLAHCAAVALFLQRAQAVRPGFQITHANASAIAQICVRLDGLPLSIELAAARSKLFPPAALLARLGQRLAILTGGARDAPARQQTLRDTLAWSYQLLEAQEQRLFRRLSVFVGGCTLQAVETLCTSLEDGAGAAWVLDRVASLLDKSLLQQTAQEGEEPRLMMLETLREYGLECLTSSGEVERTRQAHAAYYLALTQEAATTWYGPEQQAWCDRLEQEHDNLRAALQWLLEGKETALALQFSNALWWFWYTRAHVREGQTFLEKVLAASEEVATPARAEALHFLGLLFEVMGEYQQAEKSCEESLALYRGLGDPSGAAWARYALGQVAFDQDEYTRAHTLLQEALTFFREARDPLGGHFVLSHLTMVYTQQGEYVQARTCAEESLVLAKELGDEDTTAFTLLLLGKVLFVSQAASTALKPVLEEYFSLASEERDQTRMVAPDRLETITLSTRMYGRLELLGKIALSQGDVVKAHALFEESLAFYRAQGYRRDTAEALAALGQVAAVQQDYTTALARYEEGLRIARECGNKGKIAWCLEGLAAVRAARGERLQSARLWGAAEALREAIGAPIPSVYCLAYEQAVTAARTQFGEKPFTAAWAEGRTMTLEQVLAAPMLAEPVTALSVPKSPTYPAGLTTREVEVLRLVAQGLPDAQVAEQLVISPSTVNSHLKSIYGKLHVTSRSAATRYAIEHNLM